MLFGMEGLHFQRASLKADWRCISGQSLIKSLSKLLRVISNVSTP